MPRVLGPRAALATLPSKEQLLPPDTAMPRPIVDGGATPFGSSASKSGQVQEVLQDRPVVNVEEETVSSHAGADSDLSIKNVSMLLEEHFEQQQHRLVKEVGNMLASHELQMERLVTQSQQIGESGLHPWRPAPLHSGSSLQAGSQRASSFAGSSLQSGTTSSMNGRMVLREVTVPLTTAVEEKGTASAATAGSFAASGVDKFDNLASRRDILAMKSANLAGLRSKSPAAARRIKIQMGEKSTPVAPGTASGQSANLYTSASSRSGWSQPPSKSAAPSEFGAFGVKTNNSLASFRALQAQIRRDDMHSTSGFYPAGSRARKAIERMEALDNMRRQNAYNVAAHEHQGESTNALSEARRKPKSCRKRLQDMIQDVRFELFIFLLIFANVILVGIEVDYFSRTGEDADVTFLVVDASFTGLFVLEIILRMIAQGRAFLQRQQRLWNLFDCFVVVTAVAEMVSSMFLRSAGINIEYIRFIRVARVTRFLRAVRLIRLVRFIRALRTLVNSIFATLKSLVWAMMLLLMVFYGFGVAITETVGRHIHDNGDADGRLILFWGSLASSMFTLYKSITGGVSWHEVVHPLNAVGPMMVVLFVFFVTFAFFAVLNVITGVFCQSAIDSAAQDKEMVAIHQMANRQRNTEMMHALFREIDEDGSGSISIEEFEKYLNKEEVQAYFSSLEIETQDAWMLFKLLDKDGEGSIDLQEFLDGCLSIKGGAKAIHMVQLQQDNKWISELLKYFMEDVFQQLDSLQHQLQRRGSTAGSGGTRIFPEAAAPRTSRISFGDSVVAGSDDGRRTDLTLSETDKVDVAMTGIIPEVDEIDNVIVYPASPETEKVTYEV